MKIPTFPYPGGKARIASQIIRHFPRTGGCYVEPFVGRGNVFWQAATHLKFEQWWLNDIRTIPFFQALLLPPCAVPERTEAEYYRLWDRKKIDPTDQEALLIEPFLTFSGGGYGSGGFGNLKGATRDNYKLILESAHSVMCRCTPRLTSIPWEDMQLADLTENDFVYLDPPYMSADVRCYKESTINFDSLINLLSNARFRWVLSEYEQPAYIEAFGNPVWRKDVQLSVTNTKKTGERRVECLWSSETLRQLTPEAAFDVAGAS